MSAIAERQQTKRQQASTDPLAEGPRIVLDPSALGPMAGDATVLTRFLGFVRQDILQEHVPATRIEVRGSADPEDDTSQILVRIWMQGTDGDTRQYHHALGERVDVWAGHLPEAQRQQFHSRLSFQTRREANA